MALVSAVLLKHHQPKLSPEQKNFQRLSVLGILNTQNKPTFECRANAASPLNVLKRRDPSSNTAANSFVISLSHLHLTKDGISYADPQQDILIDTKNRTATTISFSMSDHGVCKSIYFNGSSPYKTSSKENNNFLTKWLSALIMQGFSAQPAI